MCTGRTNGYIDYRYVYNGEQLSLLTVSNQKLYFTYNAGRTPMRINYCGVRYYYVTNIQGDVIALLNCDENNKTTATVVEYTYNAW